MDLHIKEVNFKYKTHVGPIAYRAGFVYGENKKNHDKNQEKMKET